MKKKKKKRGKERKERKQTASRNHGKTRSFCLHHHADATDLGISPLHYHDHCRRNELK